MKVCCIRLIDSRGNAQEKSPWLTIGKTYHVLEVVQVIHRGWLLRLVGDGSNGVALFLLKQFKIVSSQVSPTWITTWDKDDFLIMSPAAWTEPEFWVRYYDGEPNAVRIFEEERRKIIDADP